MSVARAGVQPAPVARDLLHGLCWEQFPHSRFGLFLSVINCGYLLTRRLMNHCASCHSVTSENITAG